MGVSFDCITVHAITDLITPYGDYLFVSAVGHTVLAKAAARSGDSCAAKTELRRCKVTGQSSLVCK